MKTYYVWLTVLTEAYTNSLTSGLVQFGYHVGPLSDNGLVLSCGAGNSSALIALEVKRERPSDALSTKDFYEELVTLLKSLGVHYHSLIVHQVVEAKFTWRGSNIDLDLSSSMPTRFDKVE